MALYDSTQIVEYLEDLAPEPPLWPIGVAQRARARQIEHACDEFFFPHGVRLMGLEHHMGGEAAIAVCPSVPIELQCELRWFAGAVRVQLP